MSEKKDAFVALDDFIKRAMPSLGPEEEIMHRLVDTVLAELCENAQLYGLQPGPQFMDGVACMGVTILKELSNTEHDPYRRELTPLSLLLASVTLGAKRKGTNP